ncbi:MAG: FlgD immunoglobulin-like domain containing protein, partial [candidate division WOR-3 bacterium]
PGESADLVVTLKNAGRVGVTNVTALLRSSDQWVSIADSLGIFGALPPDSSRSNSADRFRITAAVQTPREHPAVMKLILTGTDYEDSVQFTIVVGELRAIDPIPDGPRTPALFWAYDDVDSGYVEHPAYDWVEINGVGTRLTLSDDQTQTVSLPSGFGPWRYYGQSYSQVSICSNGWVSPGSTSNTAYQNQHIPDGSQPANLCLLWQDLYPPVGNGVWYHHDAANHRFIVEYDSVRKYSPSTSFVKGEFIIYDSTVQTPTGDNVIVLQYKYCNDFSVATVGIEDPTCAIGIELLYGGTYNRGCAPFAAGRAVKYTTQDPTGVAEWNPPEARSLRLRLAGANPGRAGLMLEYAVPAATALDLAMYDGAGRRVRTLASGQQSVGRHVVVWDGRDSKGRQMPAGIYWARVVTSQYAEAVKSVLVR